MTRVDVAVVIPARNVAPWIGEQLDALTGQDYGGGWEVIVADNGSTDNTAAIVQQRAPSFPVPLRLIDASARVGVNAARNAGIAATTADRIVICDGDDVVAPGWLTAMVKALETADVVGGALEHDLLNSATDPAYTLRIECATALRSWRGLEYVPGGNLGMWRRVWVDLGGFDERFKTGFDEIDFSLRARTRGYVVVHEPLAIIHYRLRGTPADLRRQRFRYGRGERVFLNVHEALAHEDADRVSARTRRMFILAAKAARRVIQRRRDHVLEAEVAWHAGYLAEWVGRRLGRT